MNIIIVKVHWQLIRRQINQWRQKILNMRSFPIWKGVVSQMQQQKLNNYLLRKLRNNYY